MAESNDRTVALFFSPKAAEDQGALWATTPEGKVQYTAIYETPEAGNKHYGFADSKVVWSGRESDVSYLPSAPVYPLFSEMSGSMGPELTAEALERGKKILERMRAVFAEISTPYRTPELEKKIFDSSPWYKGDGPRKNLDSPNKLDKLRLPNEYNWEPLRDFEFDKSKGSVLEEIVRSISGQMPKAEPNKEPLLDAKEVLPHEEKPVPVEPKSPLPPAGENVKPINLVFCQDAHSVHSGARKVAELMQKSGYVLNVTCVENQPELLDHLADLASSGKPGPDAVFMDVNGVGEEAALKVAKWFDKNRPEQPLPALNFLSLSTSMAITEAVRVRQADERLQAHFVDPKELSWLGNYLSGGDTRHGYMPESATFREILNDRLGLEIPLDHAVDSYNATSLKQLKGVTNDRVISAWLSGKLTPAETIERMRTYALGVASALREGLYGQQGGIEGLETDAHFYASAGIPAKGRAVFSLAEVDRAAENGEKPVLFMQSYDPAVAPVLASGKLGGLVVTSPYMASHLKLLCETHMVSGLFGMKPPGPKSLKAEFNEEARPDLPPYFDANTAEIAGKPVKRGQQVLVALGGDGLSLTPPKSVQTTAMDPDLAENDEKLGTDLRNLRQIERCFAAYFESQGLPVRGVKANVDSGRKLMKQAKGIGLVRTEQMVATNTQEVAWLKRILLQGDADAQRNLADELRYDYSDVMRPLRDGKPVKIRLFDFVHREILNPAEQKKFVERYGKLDIHGGEALDTWPELYRNQIESIFRGLKKSGAAQDTVPLEIMMPAIRTEADVVKVKEMVDAAAQAAGIPASRYSFGAMIETLEACKNIASIAKHCDFISYGTNDLTSEHFNMARSDLKAHAGFAAKNGYNPFLKLSPDILALMDKTTAEGRGVNPKLRVDVCGAQAADPETAMSLFGIGVDNVSVAPTLSNICALPVLLAYRAFDALKPAIPKATITAAQMTA